MKRKKIALGPRIKRSLRREIERGALSFEELETLHAQIDHINRKGRRDFVIRLIVMLAFWGGVTYYVQKQGGPSVEVGAWLLALVLLVVLVDWCFITTAGVRQFVRSVAKGYPQWAGRYDRASFR